MPSDNCACWVISSSWVQRKYLQIIKLLCFEWSPLWHSIHPIWQFIWYIYLIFHLAYLLTSYLVYLLTFYLVYLLTFYLAFYLTFYLVYLFVRWGLLDFMSVDFCRRVPPSAAFRLLGTSTRTIHAKGSLSTPSVACRISTARIPVRVSCRTSTVTIHAQCSLPDLNRNHPRPVFPVKPQPPERMPNDILSFLRLRGGKSRPWRRETDALWKFGRFVQQS